MTSSATTLPEELSRLAQALLDVNACDGASVALLHCPSGARERGALRLLAATARDRQWVTADVSLRESGLESPDGLLREVLGRLVVPGESRPCGLLGALDRFRARHGKRSAERFEESASSSEAGGDLTALCREYLAAGDDTDLARRAYTAWLEGVAPPRKAQNRRVRRPLSERTAQRSLGELSRIVRALGHRGTFILLSDGDALAGRTERQREKGYTVLREMVDNFDGWGGAAATRVVLAGQSPLFEGEHSILSVVPLRMRLEVPSGAEPVPPHRSWTTLAAGSARRRHRAVAPPDDSPGALRNLIRISEGLPPTEKVTQMSVGQERLDRTIRRLFEVVGRAGSFFSVLVGEYGSGKTHLMMHLAERALEDRRPVFWLNLERTNIDLGNPARHLSRFLEHSELPLRGRPNAVALAGRWTRSPSAVTGLEARLIEIGSGEGHAATAARKAMRVAENARDVGFALENFLIGADLDQRPGDASYRLDAYRRIFLWFELLARQEEIRGPVILIDEAENLYTSGRPPASRRTSLRSLSFYCGGALPGACVIMAMTPPAFEAMKKEARDLLAEAGDMDTTLELEDVGRFRRSLHGLKPDPVKPLTAAERAELCERVRRMHRSVRGPVELADWEQRVAGAVKQHASPRTLVRALVDELESTWWAG
ncbi:MAG TPA: BREX system ATP-binding domain-containing protein [Kofleriaceae bacterium]|nr:BREX system ATP-binding domain-containing protein [Kofleriaceae bacterium]